MTFDQAPFRNSASWVVATALKSALSNKFPAFFLDPLDKFIWSFDPQGLGLSPDGLAARETKVSNISVQGEVASTSNSFRIGTELSPLTHGDYAHPVDLHSQSLLTAFLQSQQTAASGKALNDVTFKLTDLLGMIFDKRLFANDTDPASDKVNLLEHLVRHEAGVAADLVTGAAAITADAMVTRFTSDLWKLAQDGGLTVSESTTYSNWNNVSKTLIAFAMQKYYDEKSSSIGVGEALFKDVSGGIQFDTAAVVGEGNSITSAKGFTQTFQTYLDTTGLLSPEERTLIQSILPQLRDWYVQAGTAGMNASDTLNRGAFLLGGNGADALVGGTAADLLVGNAGDDLLQGGQGNDTLLGGSGNDAYVYATGDGLDTILDTSGQNTLAEDGVVLSGGDQYGDARVHRSADGKHLYVDAGQSNLIIDGNIVIQNYASGGSFGLNMTGAVADVNPTTTLDIVGDRAPLITGVQIGYDSLSNIITDPNTPEANRADYLNGSTASDHITSGGGDDQIYATQGGNDLIETGSGRDWVGAGSGNDVIIGGAEGDILNGGDGNDRIYADSQIDVATAIAQGNTQTGTGLQGDWLAGGAGDDTNATFRMRRRINAAIINNGKAANDELIRRAV